MRFTPASARVAMKTSETFMATWIPLLERSSPQSQDIDGPRSEQGEGCEGNARLHHHRDLRPARKHRRIGGRESSAGIESEKQIIHKPGRPRWIERRLRTGSQRHLGKQKVSLGVTGAQIADMRTASIEAPIPGSKDQDVGDPERGRGAQQS